MLGVRGAIGRRPEHQHPHPACGSTLSQRLSVANRCNLILFRPHIVAKDFDGSTFLRLEAEGAQKSKSRAKEQPLENRDFTEHCLGSSFLFISCPTRGKQANNGEIEDGSTSNRRAEKRWTLKNTAGAGCSSRKTEPKTSAAGKIKQVRDSPANCRAPSSARRYKGWNVRFARRPRAPWT